MSQFQKHGFQFEDIIIKQKTKLSKTEYNKKYKISPTSKFDIYKHSEYDIRYPMSIKTTKSNNICCGDIERFIFSLRRESFTLLIGRYKQVQSNKRIYKLYEFNFTPELASTVTGNIPESMIYEYVDHIKSIEPGKDAQIEKAEKE